MKLVAPRIGKVELADGSTIKADGQLAGTPSVLFDAVAVILSEDGAGLLSRLQPGVQFVLDAFCHLKAIAVDAGGRRLLARVGVVDDGGIIDATRPTDFVRAAMTRQWQREAIPAFTKDPRT